MNTVDVRLEISTLSEPLPTLAAGEVADFLMHRQDMPLEISFLTKFSTAGGTLVHTDSRMHRQDMLLEIFFVTKFCAAGGTLVLPYFIMYSLHMKVNFTLAGEFPLASIAQKGTSLLLFRLVNLSDFLPLGARAVHPMVGQQITAGETYAAGGTQMDISRPVLLSTESVQALKKR